MIAHLLDWLPLVALFGGGPSAPATPVLPPAAAPPTLANPAVSMAGADQRSKAAAAAGAGFDSTLTNVGGAQGLQPAADQTAKRSLLG